MEDYKLKYWTKLSNWSYLDHHPHISLHMEGYFCLTASVTPDGNIRITTHTSAGHGEPSWTHEGLTRTEWVDLIDEAELVRKHYF